MKIKTRLRAGEPPAEEKKTHRRGTDRPLRALSMKTKTNVHAGESLPEEDEAGGAAHSDL